MANNSILAKMAVQITAQNAEFKRALSKSQKDLSAFTGNLTKMAGALGVAFSVNQVANFALEISKLAGEAEAVRAAFERLPESTRLMDELKRATGGTVSELALMKRAVQASNFEISLEALPRLLKFATLRAQQTGQSVDYLVDSIITGIGRKSKLILDNLGISAVQLNEALGGTSTAMASVGDVADAVGKIAESNLRNMEGFSENASTKLQRLAASWENVKVAMGDAANGTGLLAGAIDAFTLSLDVAASKELSFLEKLQAFFGGGPGMISAYFDALAKRQLQATKDAEKQEQVIREVDHAFKEFNGDIEAYGRAITTHIYRTELLAEFTKRLTQQEQDRVTTLEELKEAEKELNDLFVKTDVTDQKKLQNTANEIISIREKIKAIEDLLKVEKSLSQTAQRALQDTPVRNVSTFGELITKTTPEGGVLQNFKGVAGEKTPLSDAIPVDIKRMEEMAKKMVELRNASFNATTEMKQHWIDLSGVVGGAISNLAEGLGGAITGVEDFGIAVLNAFADFAKQFGQMLIASGVAALALNRLITNPATAIAAGVALVAVAGAASSALSRAHAGLTGGGSSGAPGRLPSENVRIEGRIHGYDLALVSEKEGYRRGRVG